MRDFRKEKRLLRARMRGLRGIIRKYRANIASSKAGCSKCAGNALKASILQHDALQKQYAKIVEDQRLAEESSKSGK